MSSEALRFNTLQSHKCAGEIYAGAFDLEYDVEVFCWHKNDITNSTLVSDSLPTRTQATYVQYKQLARLCVDDRALGPLLERMRTEGGRIRVCVYCID